MTPVILLQIASPQHLNVALAVRGSALAFCIYNQRQVSVINFDECDFRKEVKNIME
jgi:hypothetical protein